ncbi:MAG: O-antigen ligase family protein [Lysobacterales bacterium]
MRTPTALLILMLLWTACAVWPGASEPAKLAGLLVGAALLGASAAATSPPRALLVWLAVSALSAVCALDGSSWLGSYARAQGWLALPALGIVAMSAARLGPDQRRMLRIAIAVLATLLAGYALLQRLGLDPIQWVGAAPLRPAATLSNANVLAGWLVLAAPITALCAWTERRLRALAAAALLLQLAGLWASGTRSGMLALLLAAMLVWAWPSARRLWALALALPLALALAIAARPASVQDRLQLWSAGAQAVVAAPLVDLRGQIDPLAAWRLWIGYGPDQQAAPLQRALAQQPRRDGAQDWQADRAHQGLLDLLLQYGVLGLLAAMAVLLSVARALWQRRGEPEGLALAAALLAWLVHLQAGFPLTADRTLAWLLIGCALATTPSPKPARWGALAALVLLLAAAALSGRLPSARAYPALAAERAYLDGQQRYAAAMQRREHVAQAYNEAAQAFVAGLQFRPYDRDAALAAASAYAESAAHGDAAAAAAARELLQRAAALDASDPRLAAIRARLRGVDSRD